MTGYLDRRNEALEGAIGTKNNHRAHQILTEAVNGVFCDHYARKPDRREQRVGGAV